MAETNPKLEIIRQVPLFTGLNNRQMKTLADRLTEREYEKGESIIVQGKGGQGLFIIAEGTAEAVRELPDGEQVKVNDCASGDFFGELALLDDGVRTATVRATSIVKCLVLVRWDLQNALTLEPEIAISMLEELTKRFRRALEKL